LCSYYDNERKSAKIGGVGLTVEIDECHIFSNKRRIWRIIVGESFWVVAGICRETRDVFFDVTLMRNAEYLTELILSNVIQGTKIITDFWKG
jgi:hypothetical protein